jgi:AraC-like DNA-binding protein
MQKRSRVIKLEQSVPLTFYEVKFEENLPVAGIFQKQGDDPVSFLHAHNSFEIGYCHSGSGIFTVENKILPYTAGSVCIITSREFHLAQSTPGTVSLWTFIYMDLPKLLRPGNAEELEISDCSRFAGPDFNNILFSENFPLICAMGKLLAEEFNNRKPNWLTALRGIMWVLLSEMHRRLPAETTSGEPDFCDISLIAPALDRIAEEYRKQLDIPGLAELCCMSPGTFRRHFNAVIGCAPLNYLHTIRIQMASLMLKDSNAPISEIASAVGYSSLSSFNRQFLKCRGVSPREFRSCQNKYIEL